MSSANMNLTKEDTNANFVSALITQAANQSANLANGEHIEFDQIVNFGDAAQVLLATGAGQADGIVSLLGGVRGRTFEVKFGIGAIFSAAGQALITPVAVAVLAATEFRNAQLQSTSQVTHLNTASTGIAIITVAALATRTLTIQFLSSTNLNDIVALNTYLWIRSL